MMESINVVIDDTISEKDVDEDGEGPSLRKNEGDNNMSQSDDGERESPENESTSPTTRRETRTIKGSLSPLTPLEVQPPISCDGTLPFSKTVIMSNSQSSHKQHHW